jgi:DNA-binding NarL/FixJ family response regulator
LPCIVEIARHHLYPMQLYISSMNRVGVLLVDDSPRWTERLGDLANSADLEVIGSAASPAEAISAVKRLKPPVLILDMYLEGGSGLEVLEALHSSGIKTQIVVLTGSPSERLRKACSNLGARFFLDKALDFDGLEAALKTLRSEYSNEKLESTN